MKAMNLICLGVATLLLILGLGLGNVAGQQGDARPPEGQKGADLARDLEKARVELQKARQEIEELRQIAAKERARAEQATQEARRQAEAAQQAEAEARKRAEAARREVEQALIQARQEQADLAQAEKARYLAAIAQAEKELAQKAGKGKALDVNAALADLDREKAAVLQKFDNARAELAKQMEALESHQRQVLAHIETRKAELLGKVKEKPQKKPSQPRGGDKLDKILDRLDAVEKRLDRIEKGKPQGE
jgi:colicin import membrane protein